MRMRPGDLRRSKPSGVRARSREVGTDGVPGQVAELRGLRHGVHLDGRRAALLRRQEFQERAEAMQVVQGQAGVPSLIGRSRRARAGGDDDELLGVRQRNDRAVPSHTGPAGVLPRMFPVAEICRRGRRLIRAIGAIEGHAARGLFFSDGSRRPVNRTSHVRNGVLRSAGSASHLQVLCLSISTCTIRSCRCAPSADAGRARLRCTRGATARRPTGGPRALRQWACHDLTLAKKPIEQASDFIADDPFAAIVHRPA